MADFLTLTLPALIGSVAWLYQKTWDRHERRLQQYQAIVDELPAFTTSGLSPDRIDLALAVHRRLWLLAPDSVIRAFDRFLSSIEGAPKPDDVKEEALGNLILEMRRDATFYSALLPRKRTSLKAQYFKIKSATRANSNKIYSVQQENNI